MGLTSEERRLVLGFIKDYPVGVYEGRWFVPTEGDDQLRPNWAIEHLGETFCHEHG